jgi:hypothetical protein
MSDPHVKLLAVLETQLAPEASVQLARYRKELDNFQNDPIRALAFLTFMGRKGQPDRMRDALEPLLAELAKKLKLEDMKCVCPVCIVKALAKRDGVDLDDDKAEAPAAAKTDNDRTLH